MDLKDKAIELLHQHITFKTINLLVDALVWAYFIILLYKQTESITVIFNERLITFLSLGVSFLVVSFMLDRIGYLRMYKLSIALQTIAILSALAFQDNLKDTYIFIAILHGISRGIYWPIEHSYQTRNIQGDKRSSTINIMTSIALTIGILIPFMAGAIIQLSESYTFIFVLGAMLNIAILFYPFRYNHISNTNIRNSEIKKILKHENAKEFFLISAITGASQSLYSALFLIVPYIFLKSELSVGSLISLAGFFAAVFSFLGRNKYEHFKIKLGYIGTIIWVFIHIILSIFWVPIVLVYHAIINAFHTATGINTRANTDYTIREKILGSDIDESSIEMNLMIETIYASSRVVTYTFCIILVNTFDGSLDTILRIMIPFVSFILLLSYHLTIRLNNKMTPEENKFSLKSIFPQRLINRFIAKQNTL